MDLRAVDRRMAARASGTEQHVVLAAISGEEHRPGQLDQRAQRHVVAGREGAESPGVFAGENEVLVAPAPQVFPVRRAHWRQIESRGVLEAFEKPQPEVFCEGKLLPASTIPRRRERRMARRAGSPRRGAGRRRGRRVPRGCASATERPGSRGDTSRRSRSRCRLVGRGQDAAGEIRRSRKRDGGRCRESTGSEPRGRRERASTSLPRSIPAPRRVQLLDKGPVRPRDECACAGRRDAP